MTTRCLALCILAAWPVLPCMASGAAPVVDFVQEPGKITVTIGGEPMATYCYADESILRPYFAYVRAPGGIQVTRNQPPIDCPRGVTCCTLGPGPAPRQHQREENWRSKPGFDPQEAHNGADSRGDGLWYPSEGGATILGAQSHAYGHIVRPNENDDSRWVKGRQ